MVAREQIANEFKRAAMELEKAAVHCRISAERFIGKDVPSGCAHAFASLGHISKATASIERNAETHSDFASISESSTHD